jgi:hypothetical protein
LIIWKDKGQQENWTGMVEKIGCTMGQAFGTSSYDLVNGGLWSVSDTSQTLSRQISNKVGGEAVHIDCKDVEIPGS